MAFYKFSFRLGFISQEYGITGLTVIMVGKSQHTLAVITVCLKAIRCTIESIIIAQVMHELVVGLRDRCQRSVHAELKMLGMMKSLSEP
jgi:hypothetical protein